MKTKDLTQIPSNLDVQVVEINGGHRFKDKIEALGVRNGVKVRKLSAQVLNGPITIKIGNTKIAIGHGMAKKILVKSD